MSLLWYCRVAVAALLIPPLLRVISMERLVGSLGRRARLKRPSQSQQEAIAAAVDSLLNRLPAPWQRTCLTRSTVLYHLLRRSGVEIDLCLGVKPDMDGMRAHAWLEYGGELYLEPADARSFQVIARFPAGVAG